MFWKGHKGGRNNRNGFAEVLGGDTNIQQNMMFEFSKIQKKYTINDKPEMIDFYMIQNDRKKIKQGRNNFSQQGVKTCRIKIIKHF